MLDGTGSFGSGASQLSSQTKSKPSKLGQARPVRLVEDHPAALVGIQRRLHRRLRLRRVGGVHLADRGDGHLGHMTDQSAPRRHPIGYRLLVS
ncbi:MAG: hypothetical protein QM733_12005 [Ilumatobacteraceae bacterium]